MNRRERIGRWSDIATRQFIYRTDAGLEIDNIDHFEITRKRVFYDDILLVTRHRYIGPWFVTLMLLLGIGFITIGVLLGERSAMITFAAIAAPFLIVAAVRVLMGVDVVTVFGKRSRAQMRFIFRKAKARRVVEEIAEKAREAQQRLADPPE
ncbi:MAG TPA: hypothetical protein VJ032_06380 [Thermoanaerobaculia bacterium]|nr:hypothetical protein [Thermoanaerobaculia bacterium]